MEGPMRVVGHIRSANHHGKKAGVENTPAFSRRKLIRMADSPT